MGHYDPRLPDPAPPEQMPAPPAHDLVAYLQGLFRSGPDAELDQLAVTADVGATENATEAWSLSVRATSEAITPEQETAAGHSG